MEIRSILDSVRMIPMAWSTSWCSQDEQSRGMLEKGMKQVGLSRVTVGEGWFHTLNLPFSGSQMLKSPKPTALGTKANEE